MRKLVLLALGSVLLSIAMLASPLAQVKPTPVTFASACDLQELNRAYIASLNRLRHQLDPHAPVVVFDPALFTGAVLQAAKMEAADSMFHASPLRSVELIGEKRYMQTPEVEKLVRSFELKSKIQNDTVPLSQTPVTYTPP